MKWIQLREHNNMSINHDKYPNINYIYILLSHLSPKEQYKISNHYRVKNRGTTSESKQ